MKIKVEIELGNAAMLTGNDVADALRQLANSLESVSEDHLDLYTKVIRDVNGNRVITFH